MSHVTALLRTHLPLENDSLIEKAMCRNVKFWPAQPSSLTYVTEHGEGVADVPDRMVGEGEKGVVGGEGVPPGGEGGFPRPVPEHSHALALSPETHTKSVFLVYSI